MSLEPTNTSNVSLNTEAVQNLIDNYWQWLRDRTALRQIGSYVEITTPFLDRHNDYLQIYVTKDDKGLLLTDDAYIIEDLRHSGCELTSKKRQELLTTILNGYGVERHEDQLIVRASETSFRQKKHNLVQAMLAVNDMFYTASATVQSLFLEDVAAWLDLSEVRYVPRVKFTGKSGNDHFFDFVVPGFKDVPERIIQAVNNPSRNNTERFVFSWVDTRDTRKPDSRAYVLLNDFEKEPSSDTLSALRAYDVMPVLWSQRESVRQELAA